MARFVDPNVQWWLSLAGWSVLVALWHTTIAALLLAIWRAGRWRATSSREYGVTTGLLALATVLTAATPFLLAAWPRRAPMAVPSAGALLPVAGVLLPPRLMPDLVSRPMPLLVDAGLIAWVGLVWLAGACAGVLRLGGGWLLALRIRRAASPVSEPAVLECAETVCRAHRVSPALLASDHVDAPVVIGHRHPAILLPRGAERQLPPGAIEPLLAHEVAHIVRRDYAVNVLQSFADALLFFSPGARWISRCVRDVREFCCDDAVAARWGAEPYVRSLATLAALGAAAHARPALNAAGPRVIVRIRRLLDEDVASPFMRVRVVAALGVLAVAVVAGFAVVPLAARQASAAPSARPSAAAIPIGWASNQLGSSVTLRTVASSPAGLCGTAVVRNDADRAVTSLQFVAALTAIGPRPSGVMALSDRLDVRIEPGEEATVSPNVLPESEARWRMADSRIQVMCGLVAVQFDNGFAWAMTPNPAATTADEMLGLPRTDLPRALVGQPPGPNPYLCLDEARLEYSQGAVIAIRHEPGRFARCLDGAWSEYELPSTRPAPAR